MQIITIPEDAWNVYARAVRAYDATFKWKHIEVNEDHVYTGVGKLLRLLTLGGGQAQVMLPSASDGNMVTTLTDTPLAALSGIDHEIKPNLGLHIDFYLDGAGLAFPWGYDATGKLNALPSRTSAVPWVGGQTSIIRDAQSFKPTVNFTRIENMPLNSPELNGWVAAHDPEWRAKRALEVRYEHASQDKKGRCEDVPIFSGLVIFAGDAGDGKTSMWRKMLPNTFTWGTQTMPTWSPWTSHSGEPPPYSTHTRLARIRSRDYQLNFAVWLIKERRKAAGYVPVPLSHDKAPPRDESILIGDDSDTAGFYNTKGALTTQGVPRMYFVSYVSAMSSAIARFTEREGIPLVYYTLINLTDIKAGTGVKGQTGVPVEKLFTLGAVAYYQIDKREEDHITFKMYSRYWNNRRPVELIARKD